MEKITHKIKYLGFYQLIGGIIGILNTIRLIPNFTQINGGIFLLFILLFFLFWNNILLCQQPTSYNYTTTNGLPSSESYDIIQDK